MIIRQRWIVKEESMTMVQQCALAGVCRATIYAQQKPRTVDEDDLLLSVLIDEEYTRRPFYGSRKMVVFLKTIGHPVNRKRVQRLMRQMSLAGMAPGPNTSRPHPLHKVYPYRLCGVSVVRPNQVWSTDITYIRLAHGFAYLVAIIDWYSRRVLSWRISNSMDAVFCVDCLEDVVYRTAIGGGALIVDKYPHTVGVDEPPVPLCSTRGSSTTKASAATTKLKTGQRFSAANELECTA